MREREGVREKRERDKEKERHTPAFLFLGVTSEGRDENLDRDGGCRDRAKVKTGAIVLLRSSYNK